MEARTILHVDMDAFFAAVEEREDPSLRGKPVVVGADPKGGQGRGVVSTANYQARKYGIGSAMPIGEAWRRCPTAVFLPPNGKRYGEASRAIFEIFRRYTELVQGLSVDEAFLDVTGSRRLFGDGPTIARAIKEAIREEQSLTASVGVAPSKYVAKVASDLEKPDGLVVVDPGEEAAFLAPLPIRHLWGAGPKAQQALRRIGCRTIGDVAALQPEVLERRLGSSMGRHFHRLSRGIDERLVHPGHERKSLGKERTFGEDVADRRVVERRLLGLCEGVAASLRRKGLAGTTVTVKLRFEGFETLTRRRTLDTPVDTVEALWPAARELFRAVDRPKRKVRLIGVTVSGFDHARTQLGLFEPEGPDLDHRVAEVVDRLSERYGRGTVTRAALLEELQEQRGAKDLERNL
jgi:nucleotidyltransferase/DNA polymerase involved in DNA repair